MIEIPKQLREKEFRFILLKTKDKIPFELDWQKEKNYRFDDSRLLSHIKSGSNYGVATGFGKLLVFDFDSKEMEKKYVGKLPLTFAIKTGSGGLHLYFFTDDTKSFKFNKIDFQGTGKQVVGAGSIHPNGNRYEIVGDHPIATISREKINSLFKQEDIKEEKKEKDNTRSAKEFREILKLLKQEKTRKEIFEEMKAFAKWSETTDAYKEFTYNKAYDWFLENEERDKNKKVSRKTNLKIDNYSDNVKELYKTQPFFYDRAKLFWLWRTEKYCWELVDETDILILIDNELGFAGQLVSSVIKSNYLEAFKQVGRSNIPNEAPKTWVQFKGTIFDIKTKEFFDASPKYLICNPIPWEIGDSEETPTIDKLFKDWVNDDYVKTLHEIIAYCCLTDYPIHLVFCLVGCGRNGKSRFQALVNKFLGNENICSTELDLLIDNRFESAKLFKKLVCLLGETNFGVLKKTSLLKKLCGGDLIGYEFKNKNPFDAENYAKIIISSNSLPTSEDTSEGFYRRWMIIDFMNSFKEGKDILSTIPEEEYNNLAKKVTKILPELIEKGEFTNQGTIEERELKFKLASNPISIFIKELCDRDDSYFIKSNQLYQTYCDFLRKIKARIVTRKEFNTALSEFGLYSNKTTKTITTDKTGTLLEENRYESGYWVDGINLKQDFMTVMTVMTRLSLKSLYREMSE